MTECAHEDALEVWDAYAHGGVLVKIHWCPTCGAIWLLNWMTFVHEGCCRDPEHLGFSVTDAEIIDEEGDPVEGRWIMPSVRRRTPSSDDPTPSPGG